MIFQIMSDVAMLYHGNSFHPAHRGFAESIDADIISVVEFAPESEKSPYEEFKSQSSVGSFLEEFKNGYSIGEYDIIISEGSRPLYTGLVHKLFYNSKLIYLCADHRLREIWQNSVNIDSIYTLFKYLLGKYGKGAMRTIAQQGIDGVIAVSEFVEDYLRPIFQDRVPSKIVHPYIQPDLFDSLGKTTPNIGQNVAVTVGRNRKYKGIDTLVEAWPDIRKRHPSAKLNIVGKDHPKSYEDTPGVSVLGFVEEIKDAYASAGLYIQPSRADPFPVTVLEALRAGLPAVVTESTGNYTEISELNDQLIVPTTTEGITEAVNWYFELSRTEKEKLSNSARIRGKRFGPKEGKKIFRQGYNELLKQI